MPEWMTPLLCPVWCVASSDSFSQITRESEGVRSSNARAVARPTMPPPMIATSYVIGSYYSRPRGGRHGAIDVSDVSRRALATGPGERHGLAGRCAATPGGQHPPRARAAAAPPPGAARVVGGRGTRALARRRDRAELPGAQGSRRAGQRADALGPGALDARSSPSAGGARADAGRLQCAARGHRGAAAPSHPRAAARRRPAPGVRTPPDRSDGRPRGRARPQPPPADPDDAEGAGAPLSVARLSPLLQRRERRRLPDLVDDFLE